MQPIAVKRVFRGQLTTGIAALSLSFALALVLWPAWSLAVKALYTGIAGPGLGTADPKLVGQLIGAVARGTFFWMVINPWIWLTLVMGNHGKTAFTTRQPWAGIWYVLLGWGLGALAFVSLTSFLGIWWKPFSLSLMFTPQSAADVQMAFEGWEASNFYALAVIVAQIPLVSLLQKWPFAGKAEKPADGLGVLAMGIAVTWIVWMAMIVPHFLKLSMGEHQITTPAFGNWPAFVAFCQAFVIFAIMPVEGGELYPMKLFAKKQPLMGIVGFVIALAAGFIVPPIVKAIIAPLNLVAGPPLDVVVASLELSVIVFMLAWHHLFEDYPSATLVPNATARVLCRVAIWFGGGTVYGVLWLKTFKLIPFGANDLGMGVPALGILAGQFALLMTFLFLNTFFDKWPLVRKVEAPAPQTAPVPGQPAVALEGLAK
jgi:AAT family amino acid transporter